MSSPQLIMELQKKDYQMEITIRNTTPQMTPVIFDSGDEYELQSETLLTLTCNPGAEIAIQGDQIEARGITSPLGNDEPTDEEENI